ncbi:MAG: hypothetical protein Q4E58_12120 [Prevotellaceae bacterium]|jgi:hypothetical protein|nr:hypothetical protein [Prevotellaceae bacterium]
MKKYIAPKLTVVTLNEEQSLLAGTLVRDAKWGGDPQTSDFANPNWENEGYEKKPYTGGSTIEDDNGDLNSYSKIFDDVVE